jgi:hypothetical protein
LIQIVSIAAPSRRAQVCQCASGLAPAAALAVCRLWSCEKRAQRLARKARQADNCRAGLYRPVTLFFLIASTPRQDQFFAALAVSMARSNL